MGIHNVSQTFFVSKAIFMVAARFKTLDMYYPISRNTPKTINVASDF